MIPKQVNEFLDGLGGRSPKTIQNYVSFANVFWTYTKKPVKRVTVTDIMTFLNHGIKDEGWKISTMKQYAQLALRFMSEFKNEAFVKELKKQVRMLPKIRKYANLYEGVYVPSNRIDDFIDAAPNDELEVCFTMILKWGLRLSEALTFRVEDVNAKIARVTAHGKGGGLEHKARPVWVDRDSLRKVLRFLHCSEDQITGTMPITKHGKILNLSPRYVELAWKQTARKIGLPMWKKLTPHDGRHSYAIDFLIKRKKEGMRALVLLKNQLGHTDINTTNIYLDIAGTEAREVFDAGVNIDESS